MQTKESLLLGQTGYLFLVFSNNVYMVIISSYNKIKAITHGLDSSYLSKMNENFFSYHIATLYKRRVNRKSRYHSDWRESIQLLQKIWDV